MFTNRSKPQTDQLLSLSAFYQQTHEFITSSSSAASSSSPLPPVTVVMGNESSDFDSTVSASVLAWYLAATEPAAASSSSSHSPRYVPVINVPRRHFRLRTEIGFDMQRVGVDASQLTFIDDVDLHSLASRCGDGNFHLVLTDHNRLTSRQEWLGQYVVGIVDHHEDEQLYPSSAGSRLIAKSGSCCAHVACLIASSHPELLSSSFSLLPIVQLLTDVILVDTHNLEPAMKKATQTDTEAIAFLSRCQHALLFQQLKALRNEVSGWTTADLLLKDSKTYAVDRCCVMISTVPRSLQLWQQQNPNLIPELVSSCAELDALIVLTSFTDKQSRQYKRDLLLIVPARPQTAAISAGGSDGKAKLPPAQLFELLARGLEADERLQLKVVDTSRAVPGLRDGEHAAVSGVGAVDVTEGVRLVEAEHGLMARRYDQLNISSSRKQVAPCVEHILAKL